jgi:hypothetical protein
VAGFFFAGKRSGIDLVPVAPGVAAMTQGDKVRVVKLTPRPRAKVGPDVPKVGEMGVIQIVVNDSQNRLSRYIVEHTRPNGVFGWSADFTVVEIEQVK